VNDRSSEVVDPAAQGIGSRVRGARSSTANTIPGASEVNLYSVVFAKS
jgi:hypothetical protein